MGNTQIPPSILGLSSKCNPKISHGYFVDKLKNTILVGGVKIYADDIKIYARIDRRQWCLLATAYLKQVVKGVRWTRLKTIG